VRKGRQDLLKGDKRGIEGEGRNLIRQKSGWNKERKI
jgi:hypothetical protein